MRSHAGIGNVKNKGFDILFFSAHPDDAEFAAGGTLLKLSRKYKVANIILTKGEAGTYGTPKQRVAEALKAAQHGGYHAEFLDFKDNFINDSSHSAHRIADVIRRFKPKVLFATYHTQDSFHLDGVSHPDHAATGRLVLKAARFAKFKNALLHGKPHAAKRIIYYMIPRRMTPSFVVDVSEVSVDLPRFWDCYKSQFRNLARGRLEDKLLTYRKGLGQLNNLDYAEGFIVEEPLKAEVEWILDI